MKIILLLLSFFASYIAFGNNKSVKAGKVECDLKVSQVWDQGSFVYSSKSPISLDKDSDGYTFLYEHSTNWSKSEDGIEKSPNINNFYVQLGTLRKDSKFFLEVSFLIVKYDFCNNIKTKNLYPLDDLKGDIDIFVEHVFGPERMAHKFEKANSFTYQSEPKYSHQTSLDDFFEGELESSKNPGIVLSGACRLTNKPNQKLESSSDEN